MLEKDNANLLRNAIDQPILGMYLFYLRILMLIQSFCVSNYIQDAVSKIPSFRNSGASISPF